MKLLEQQKLFAKLSLQLLAEVISKGYEFTYGETYRDPRIAQMDAMAGKGISKSLHTVKLAIDINLFKGSSYLSRTEDHAELGAFWKSLHPLCRWGGDFPKPDGNHYSLEWEGVK